MKALLISIGLVGALAAQGSEDAPSGYRFPSEADYSGDWKESRATVPMPFVVRADFDDDGTLDEAWLLPMSSGTGWGLFAALGAAKGPRRFVRLEEDRKTEVQGFGITLVKPGQYKTACGKGYWLASVTNPNCLISSRPRSSSSSLRVPVRFFGGTLGQEPSGARGSATSYEA